MIRIIFSIGFLVFMAFYSGKSVAQTPDWEVEPSAYQFSMNITGVFVSNCTYSSSVDNKVAAFAGEELRGVASFSTSYGNMAVAFLTLYSNTAIGEKITFKVYNSASDAVIEVEGETEFAENGVLGNLESPYQFYTGTPVLLGELSLTNENQIVYSEDQPGNVYSWYKNGELLDGEVSASIYVCQTGEYKVEVANGSCSLVSDSLEFVNEESEIVVNKALDGSEIIHHFTLSSCNSSLANYSYELVSGEGSVDNHLFTVKGDTLYLIDHETGQSRLNYNIRVRATDDFGNSFEQALEVEYVANAVGIKDALAAGLKIYPNPVSSGSITIDLPLYNDTKTVRILSLNGNVLFEEVLTGAGPNIINFENALKPGVYLIELSIKEGGLLYKKLIRK